jgi:MFS family permease
MDTSIWRLAIKDRTLFLYFLYNVLFGLYPIVPIMSLFFLAKSLTFGQIGIIFAVFSISGFVFEIPTGYFGDKFGKKVSVICGLVTLSITAFIWTLLTNTLDFAIFAAVWMLGLAFISGSFEAYIYDYLKSKSKVSMYDKVLATSKSLSYFSGAIGSILGAYLFSININYPYYLLGTLFFLSSLIVVLMRNDVVVDDKDYQEQLHILSGLIHVFRTPKILWVTLFVSLLYGFYSYFSGSVDKPYILDLKVFTVQWLGVFVAIAMMVQSLLMSQFAKLKSRLNEPGMITLCWLMYALGLAGMAFLHSYLALIAVILFYSTEAMYDALINSFSQKYIPSVIRATTLSSIKVYENIGAAILGLAGGVMFDLFTIRTGMTIALGYSCLVYILTRIYQKTVRI